VTSFLNEQTTIEGRRKRQPNTNLHPQGPGSNSNPNPGTSPPRPEPAHIGTKTSSGRIPRRRKNGNWSDQQLKSALVDFDDGVLIRQAARDNGIPASSLRGHIYGTIMQRRRGKLGMLTDAEEQELVEYLLKMQNLGFPLTIGQLREQVGILTQGRFTPFKNGVLGPGWIKCFKNKHKELVVKKAQALE